jgi:hypothetical protein
MDCTTLASGTFIIIPQTKMYLGMLELENVSFEELSSSDSLQRRCPRVCII